MLCNVIVSSKSKGGGKFSSQWPGPYMVECFAGDHSTSYHLQHIHGGRVPGEHHGNHLRMSRPRTGSLAQPFGEPVFALNAICKIRKRAMRHYVKVRYAAMFHRDSSEWETGLSGLLNEVARVVLGERGLSSVYNREAWGISRGHAMITERL